MKTNKKFYLFLAGDVMVGRGIDQILPHPDSPELYEPCVINAQDYIKLAEDKNGEIQYPVNFDYIWGDAIDCWNYFNPVIKIINLETAITTSNNYLPYKQIHYRMNPKNIDVLKTAQIDVCTLANNHILDWGYEGLEETIETLKKANILVGGIGENNHEAKQPIIFSIDSNHRILIFSAAHSSSGVVQSWAATGRLPGVYLINFDKQSIEQVINHIKTFKKNGDLIVFSIHAGSNWGYEIDPNYKKFSHQLIENDVVDIVFGHSSHHPRSIEIYKNKIIFYGCGDFINDYEGITGYDMYRGDLSLMYFVEYELNSTNLLRLKLIPMQIKKMRLHHADEENSKWIADKLKNISSLENVTLKCFEHSLNDYFYIEITL